MPYTRTISMQNIQLLGNFYGLAAGNDLSSILASFCQVAKIKVAKGADISADESFLRLGYLEKFKSAGIVYTSPIDR